MNKSNKDILQLVLFILFLTIFPEGYITGGKRIIVTFALALLVTHCLTCNWRKSVWVAVIFTLIVGLLDGNGPFSDLRGLFGMNRYESFESGNLDKIEPAGKSLPEEKRGNRHRPAETEEYSNETFDDEDLDKILSEDEKKSNDETDILKGADGLDQLKDLLNQAKKDVLDPNKKLNDYTPAQAQRATYQLIDTAKQLKETMTAMMPLMQAGKHLVNLHQKLGGDEFTKSLQE